jgi:D-serine deaminase-like pyridoxal phosphate-dependent protein
MFEHIRRPSLLVDTDKVRRNLGRMKDRADRNHVFFRPHLKTHQSPRWDASSGKRVSGRGTVSSVSMARLFADDGWDDLTIAFPPTRGNWRR